MLVDSLRAWDGSYTQALALRDDVTKAGPLRAKPVAGERGLAKLRAAKRGSGCAVANWLADNPSEIAVVAPLIGSEALSPWPWTDPFRVEERDAAAGLALLGIQCVAVDPDIRRFLRVFYREVRRHLWTAAARAIAVQAVEDPLLADAIRVWFLDAFPQALVLGRGRARAQRHALLLAAEATARGIEIPRYSPDRLHSLRASDDADRSVITLSLLVLGHPREAVARVTGGSMPITLRTVVQARELLDPPALETLRERVAGADAMDADGLLALHEAREALGMPVAIEPLSNSPLRVADEIGQLFDPERATLMPRGEWARRLVAVERALAQPEVSPVPWSRLAAVVGPLAPRINGTAGETGPAAVGVMAAVAGRPVQHLLRDAELDLPSVLRLASLDNGFVTNQLSIQLERHLRQCDGDAERVRLLWKLMIADPPSETFQKLALRIRADTDPGTAGSGPLIGLLNALCALDRLRDQGVDFEALAPVMRSVATAVGTLLAREHHPLERLVARIEAAARHADDPVRRNLAALEEVIGADPEGLVAWACWVTSDDDVSARQLAIDRLLATLRREVANLVEARPAVSPSHRAEVLTATNAIRAELTRFGWPERHGLLALIEQLEEAVEEDLARGHAASERARTIEAALTRGDEAQLLLEIQRPDTADLLSTPQLRRVHSFLLHQLRFRDADRLRHQVSERIALPGAVGRLLPLFAAVVGGSFLVLDFGSAWIDLATSWLEPRALLTTGATLLLSYGTLLITLGSRMSDGRGSLQRWARAASRVTPTWIAALVVAVGSAALVVGTLGRPWSVLPVFASLQLFLGVFFGLVLQGRPLLSQEGN